MKEAGFEVIEAKNGDVAMTLIAAQPNIAAVVMDLAMPGSVDGLELAHWMCTFAPSITIIITTGRDELPDLAEINPAIIGVLKKPYPVQKVIDLLLATGKLQINRG